MVSAAGECTVGRRTAKVGSGSFSQISKEKALVSYGFS